MNLILILQCLLASIILASSTFGQLRSPTMGSDAKQTVTLTASAEIRLTPDPPIPIQNAAKDLASDFEKIFGKQPAIVTHSTESSGLTIMIGEEAKLPDSIRPHGLTTPESFSISVARPSSD